MYFVSEPPLPPKSVRFLETPVDLLHFFNQFVNIMRNDSCQNTRNKTDDHAADPSAEFSHTVKWGKYKRSHGRIHCIINKAGQSKQQSQQSSRLWSHQRDARITGIWIIVALVNPSGIYPRKGVNAMITIITPKIAVCTICLCAHCCLLSVFCLLSDS